MRCAVERRPAGMALLTSLVVLMILAVLSAAVLDTFTLQLRMAHANLVFVQSRQAALAQLEIWLDHMALTVPAGFAGATHCPQSSGGCDYPDMPDHLHAVSLSELRVIDRDLPPPRRVTVEASSALHYRAMHYEITAGARARDDGPAVSLSQGVMVLYPGAGQ